DLNTGKLLPCGIIATNTQGTYTQQFILNVTSAPAANIAGCPGGGTCPGTSFTDGVANQVMLTAVGAATPGSWSFFDIPSAPPSWLTLTDNGNGTATLKGTPPLGTTGTFYFGVVADAMGALGIANTYPLTVVQRPVFTTPNTATFTVGTSSSFAIGAN